MSVKVQQILKPPGAGLLTVSKAGSSHAKRAERFFARGAFQDWPRHAAELLARPGVPYFILGVPSDSGGGICRGAAHGPLALREALYKKFPKLAKQDLGDIPCIPQLVHDSMLNEGQRRASAKALWGQSYLPTPAASPLSLTEDFLAECFAARADFRPLVLGGDHSISGAIFGALARAGKTRDLAVLHIDAHTDLLESRFGVEHCFGTWTSHALKKISAPAAWVQLGIRASAQPKEHWESKFGLKQFSAAELNRQDPKKFARRLLADWQALGCTALYITNDIDGTDAAFVPSTGTPEGKGFKPAWLRAVLSECSRGLPLVGADLMEVAPVLGSASAAQKTIKNARSYLEALHWH